MIQQVDIRAEWDRIRPGLETMCETWNTGWRPEDVYADCKYERAWPYVAPEGFLIINEQENRHSGEKSMHIWIAYAYFGANLIDKYMADVVALAKQCGYRKITFESPRRAWERKPEWTPGMTTYSYEVT